MRLAAAGPDRPDAAPGKFPASPEWMVMCPVGFILINGRAQSYGAVEREQGETSVVVRFGGAEATDEPARADARPTEAANPPLPKTAAGTVQSALR